MNVAVYDHGRSLLAVVEGENLPSLRWACVILLVIAGCAIRPTPDSSPWWMASFKDTDADTLALGETICAESDRIGLEPTRREVIAVRLDDLRVVHPGGLGGRPVRVRDVAFAILKHAGCSRRILRKDRRVALITGCLRGGEWTRLHIIDVIDSDVEDVRQDCLIGYPNGERKR